MIRLRNSKTGKQKFFVQGNKKHEFTVNERGDIFTGRHLHDYLVEKDETDGFLLQNKSKRYHVELIERKGNKYQVEINGNSYFFEIETAISLKRKRIIAKKKGKDDALKVQAPMPGKILEVFVEEGSNIQKGEPILILEAMKMQNEILAESSGTIDKIHVKAESSVMKDDLLIEMHA